MKKFLKVTALVLVLVVVVAVVAVGIVVTTVNPNKFKPMLSEEVRKVTGRELQINGDLSWTVYPNLGVKVGHIVLNNPDGFNEKVFAEIDELHMGVKILPLLRAKIEATGILVSGLKLNLIRLANGATNWQDLQKTALPTQQKDRSEDGPVNDLSLGGRMAMLSLDIPSVDIAHANIHWIDEASKQDIQIQDFSLHADQISLNQAFPIQSQLTFEVSNPKKSGHVSLAGQITLDLNKQIFSFQNIQLGIDVKPASLNITGDVVADLGQQTLRFSRFTGKLANMTLTGKVNVTDLSTHPRLNGHLEAAPFDLKQLLQQLGQDSDSLQMAKDVSATFDFTTTGAGFGAAAINMQGNMHINELQAEKLHINGVSVQTHMQNGVLEFAPITASLYQGDLQSQAKVDLNGNEPQSSLQANLTHIQIEPLLQDLNPSSKLKVKGAGSIDLQVTTQGMSSDAIVRNLNGSNHINFQNGEIDGIDIGYLVDTANALVNKQAPAGQSTGSTPFGSLTASGTIHNGVISNNDLLLDSPRFTTKGQGTINLVSQDINYNLETVAKDASAGKGGSLLNAYNFTIPIRIVGSLQAPSIALDTNSIIKQVAKKKIGDEIQAQLPGGAGKLLQNILGQ